MNTELERWKSQMKRDDSITAALSNRLQQRINRAIPEKVHNAITTGIKGLIEAILFGAEYTTGPQLESDPSKAEIVAHEKIRVFTNSATAEGAITGAGGILLGLADFPAWLTIKMKMLFEIAAAFGRDVSDFRERVLILHIFQLTFSRSEKRKQIFRTIENWRTEQHKYASAQDFDWRSFQQEYRDYIDVAKLLQLVPGIGAAVGAVVNNRLTKKLGEYAINCYKIVESEEQR